MINYLELGSLFSKKKYKKTNHFFEMSSEIYLAKISIKHGSFIHLA
tara:strand:- start:349 stop:486 length:138 start_codon:yes stop_codon:yes gene_type:complete